MTTTLDPPPAPTTAHAPARTEERALRARFAHAGRWRPQRRSGDPAWARPALSVLLVATAFLYLWGLGRSGWANSFYSAAVEAGTKSWKAFFFGSFDSSSFITVDKPPAALWVMEISARIFGLNSWSILVPQALEGVATVALLYATVRRWLGAGAGLLAGTILALTPVAALMFRFNNPDALLALLLMGAAYATVRAVESGRTRWLVLAGALVGTGFITKMLQTLFIVPALGVAYLIAGPPKLGRRIGQLTAGGLSLVVAAGWWVAAVELTPAKDRPYIGGSQDNSLFNLIFGYNGFGRLTGNESGSTANQWGPTGWDRLLLADFGGQISWLIPAAIVLLAGTAWMTRRGPRTDRLRTGLLLFGTWLIVSDVILSFSKGIIHPYYTVALAAPLGGTIALGAAVMWRRRDERLPRLVLAVALAATALWSFVLLDRSPDWLTPLRFAVLVSGIIVAVAITFAHSLGTRLVLASSAAAVVIALAGPAAYSLDTASARESGSIPSAGPTLTAGSGFQGFAGGARRGPAGLGATRGKVFAGFGSGGPPGGATGGGGGAAPRSGGVGGGSANGGGITRGAGGPSAGGGLLNASTPDRALVKVLESHASQYTWVAAVIGANDAAGYQLSTDDAVMAIGGFNGTDPAPSLAQFEADVRQHKIHYFIASGAGGFGGGGLGTSSTASAITSWVEGHFTSTTVGGETIYNLNV